MLRPWTLRTPPPRDPCRIDAFTGPGWKLVERHAVEVAAPPSVALAALRALRLRDLPAVRVLFALRGLRSDPAMTLDALFSSAPFVSLDEEPGREWVAGVLVPPRDGAGRREPPRSPDAFRSAVAAGAPLAAIVTFRAEPAGGGSRLWTETFTRTHGRAASLVFAGYWLAIGPFSAWIRRAFLDAARQAAQG
jgi:hypothetical protein